VTARLNGYVTAAAEILRGQAANAIFPWSASRKICLPSFRQMNGLFGRTAVVAAMDFLQGMSKAGDIEFRKVGNGRPDTDYQAKGETTVSLLEQGYQFVLCHINAPDEASHMADPKLKVKCLERIDRFIVGPVVSYFQMHPDELAGVMIVPDHYSNSWANSNGGANKRADIHSTEPVPFALWNGHDFDKTVRFSEDDAAGGKFAAEPISHLKLLRLIAGHGYASTDGKENAESRGRVLIQTFLAAKSAL
jgi:2,3-bisphosphoglycerate-independent phosphoglycerate mutase